MEIYFDEENYVSALNDVVKLSSDISNVLGQCSFNIPSDFEGTSFLESTVSMIQELKSTVENLLNVIMSCLSKLLALEGAGIDREKLFMEINARFNFDLLTGENAQMFSVYVLGSLNASNLISYVYKNYNILIGDDKYKFDAYMKSIMNNNNSINEFAAFMENIQSDLTKQLEDAIAKNDHNMIMLLEKKLDENAQFMKKAYEYSNIYKNKSKEGRKVLSNWIKNIDTELNSDLNLTDEERISLNKTKQQMNYISEQLNLNVKNRSISSTDVDYFYSLLTVMSFSDAVQYFNELSKNNKESDSKKEIRNIVNESNFLVKLGKVTGLAAKDGALELAKNVLEVFIPGKSTTNDTDDKYNKFQEYSNTGCDIYTEVTKKATKSAIIAIITAPLSIATGATQALSASKLFKLFKKGKNIFQYASSGHKVYAEEVNAGTNKTQALVVALTETAANVGIDKALGGVSGIYKESLKDATKSFVNSSAGSKIVGKVVNENSEEFVKTVVKKLEEKTVDETMGYAKKSVKKEFNEKVETVADLINGTEEPIEVIKDDEEVIDYQTTTDKSIKENKDESKSGVMQTKNVQTIVNKNTIDTMNNQGKVYEQQSEELINKHIS